MYGGRGRGFFINSFILEVFKNIHSSKIRDGGGVGGGGDWIRGKKDGQELLLCLKTNKS